jgi:hypothetical protein
MLTGRYAIGLMASGKKRAMKFVMKFRRVMKFAMKLGRRVTKFQSLQGDREKISTRELPDSNQGWEAAELAVVS